MTPAQARSVASRTRHDHPRSVCQSVHGDLWWGFRDRAWKCQCHRHTTDTAGQWGKAAEEAMRTIIRRVGRLENRFIPGDVQGPSPAQILRERRRRLLAVAGLPFDAQPPKPQMYAGARRLTNCRRTAELPRPAPLKWAFYQSGKLPIFVDNALDEVKRRRLGDDFLAPHSPSGCRR